MLYLLLTCFTYKSITDDTLFVFPSNFLMLVCAKLIEHMHFVSFFLSIKDVTAVVIKVFIFTLASRRLELPCCLWFVVIEIKNYKNWGNIHFSIDTSVWISSFFYIFNFLSPQFLEKLSLLSSVFNDHQTSSQNIVSLSVSVVRDALLISFCSTTFCSTYCYFSIFFSFSVLTTTDRLAFFTLVCLYGSSHRESKLTTGLLSAFEDLLTFQRDTIFEPCVLVGGNQGCQPCVLVRAGGDPEGWVHMIHAHT